MVITEKPSANRFSVGATRFRKPKPSCTTSAENTTGIASNMAAEKIHATFQATVCSSKAE